MAEVPPLLSNNLRMIAHHLHPQGTGAKIIKEGAQAIDDLVAERDYYRTVIRNAIAILSLSSSRTVTSEQAVNDLQASLAGTEPSAPHYVGSSSDRQSIGLPGHCDRCAEVGHVKAHPHLGCSDVGCYSYHDEPSSEPYCSMCGGDMHTGSGHPMGPKSGGLWLICEDCGCQMRPRDFP